MPIILRILAFLALLLGGALIAYGIMVLKDVRTVGAGCFMIAASVWLFTAAAALDRIGAAVRHLAALRSIMDPGARQ